LQFPESAEDDEYRLLASDLYDRVMQPLANDLEGARTIIVAPDGALNLVSFAGLIGERDEYLIERYAIHYVSSGRDLLRMGRESTRGAGLLVLGGSDCDAYADKRDMPNAVKSKSTRRRNIFLSGAASEARLVADQWRKACSEPVTMLTGSEASEENFKRDAAGKRVIHVASHGFYASSRTEDASGTRGWPGMDTLAVGENRLLCSGLLLAGSNLCDVDESHSGDEDGVLTAEEVAGMDLSGTELVVLSACESGLGKVEDGEGVYGLRRAFQTAGAQTVISALWSVSDQSTANLMGSLYRSQSDNLPQILHDIELSRIHELRASGQSDHPLNWAAFVAIGDWKFKR
jgi:CHAT domain-containing protein